MFKQYRGLRKELYIIVFGRVVTNLGSMVWPMLTLILNQKLGMSASSVAFWLLVFTFVSLPVGLLGGKLTDKFNKRNIIIICDSVSIICYFICYFIELNALAIALIALAGLFQTIEHPTYDAIVADFSLPGNRDEAYSLMYLGGNLGLTLSPTISGLLFNEHLDLVFLISGLAILSSTLLIFFFIKDVHREESLDDINEYEEELVNSTNVLSYVFSSKTLRTYLLLFVLYNIAYNQFNYLMPLDMSATYGEMGATYYGLLTSVNCLTVVCFTALFTKLLNNKNDVFKIGLGVIFMLSGLVIFKTLLPYVLCCYLAMIVFTIGEICESIGSRPFQSKRIPANYRGRVMSVFYVTQSLFVSLARLLIGNLYDNVGSLKAWLFVYIIGVLTISVSLHLRQVDRKQFSKLYQ